MDSCPALPATGGSSIGVIVVLAIISLGSGLVLVRLGRSRTGIVAAIAAIAIGVAAFGSPSAEAATDCSTTSTAAPTSVPAPTTTTPETSSPAPTTDVEPTAPTTVAPTTLAPPTTAAPSTTAPPTTDGPVVFAACATASNVPGFSYYFDLVDGFGTVTGYPGSTECTGETLGTFPVVDSNVADPVAWCAENAPGTIPMSADSAGTWTPSIPPGLFACFIGPPEVTTPTVPTTAAPEEFSVGGTVTGLVGPLVLQNNGTENITIIADGSFTFATRALSGSAYDVVVITQPPGQSCEVSNGAGTIPSADVANVEVSCSFILT